MNRRPATAPSHSLHSPLRIPTGICTDNLTAPAPLANSTPPALPPIPAILAHAPTRSHLFTHLLQITATELNLLILLLDLLAIIRANASQTLWTFDAPPPPPPPPPTTNTLNRPRPGTSDALSPLRHHTRSHIFRSSKPSTHPLSGSHSNPPIHHPTSSSSSVSTIHHQPSSWLNHLTEIYHPPQLDIQHGWFIPLPLPPQSQSFQSLSNHLQSINPNQLNLGLSPLKFLGRLACQELSELESVRDWWSQHSGLLWPQCSRQQKSQCFDDLLALWPSLHFPTPSLSQLYKISNNLSRFRTKFRFNQSPSKQAVAANQSFLSRATLRGLFEIYLNPPSPTDLEAIENFVSKSQLHPTSHLTKSFSVPTQNPAETDRPPSRSSIEPPETNSPVTPQNPAGYNDDDDFDDTDFPASHPSKSLNLRSQKLRQFFGHEVDSILPNSASHSQGRPLDHSPYILSNFSVSLGPTPNRRKSTTSPIGFDRPRKRSSTATIDISLATMATSPPEAQLERPLTPPLSGNSSIRYAHSRTSVMGNSPTLTPSFVGYNKPLDRHQQLSTYSDETATEQIQDRFVGKAEELEDNWQLENAGRDAEAMRLKRLTKLEKILGEPVTLDPSNYAGLGVKVVTEVVEDVEFSDQKLDRFEIARLRSLGPLYPSPPSRATQLTGTYSFDRPRQGLPSPSKYSFDFNHISRPATATGTGRPGTARPATGTFEYIGPPSNNHSPSSTTTTRASPKGRLGKLQKFLDDVAHPGLPKHANTHYTSAGGSPDLPPRTTSAPSLRHARKHASLFKLSAGLQWSFADSGRATSQTMRSPSIDPADSRPPTSHSSSSSLNNSVRSTIYSCRSARKLEKLLGEQVPSYPSHPSSNHPDDSGEVLDAELARAVYLPAKSIPV